MALEKPYKDVPGTTVFDAELARKGYHLNQFCMSLMKAENREMKDGELKPAIAQRIARLVPGACASFVAPLKSDAVQGQSCRLTALIRLRRPPVESTPGRPDPGHMLD